MTKIEKIALLEFKKRLLLNWIHHFESDLINNMDHMRISGTELHFHHYLQSF